MDKLSVRRGATLPLTLNLDEDDASVAELIVKQAVTDVSPVFTVTSNVIAKEADLTITSDDTDIEPGDYLYQITVTYEDGHVEKYPEETFCDDVDGVDFPILAILESLD